VIVAVAVGLGTGIALRPTSLPGPDFIWLMAMLPISYLALLVIHRYRSRVVRDAGSVTSRDARPIVLYLRPFRDEYWRVRADEGRWMPLEEVIADELGRYGPVVTAQRPVSRSLPTGGARQQLPADSWRGKVVEWMRQAQFVVVLLGQGQSLRWEVEQLVKQALLDRTAIVFGPTREHGHHRPFFDTFRGMLSDMYGGPPVSEEARTSLAREHRERWLDLCARLNEMGGPDWPQNLDPMRTRIVTVAGSTLRAFVTRQDNDLAYRTAIQVACGPISADAVDARREQRPTRGASARPTPSNRLT
jgi:hypothetical protein